MNAAISTAKKTFPFFEKNWQTMESDGFSVKMIVVGNRCFGGKTIRVLSERAPGAAPLLEFVNPPQD